MSRPCRETPARKSRPEAAGRHRNRRPSIVSLRLSFALLGLLPLAVAALGAAPAGKAATPAGKAAAPAGGAGDAFPYQVSETTLANGLKVVAIPYDSPGTLAYLTLVRTGSRDEVEAGLSGFAHFFEHMMFRGTDKDPAERYNDVLKGMDADFNAFTTDDFTLYHVVGPASQ